jgi:hypothetical protein
MWRDIKLLAIDAGGQVVFVAPPGCTRLSTSGLWSVPTVGDFDRNGTPDIAVVHPNILGGDVSGGRKAS